MKNFEIRKEVWIWLIMVLPICYLAYMWHTLPEIVPTHFGIDGKPNDWSHKRALIFIVAGLTVGIYLLFTFIPVLDPKSKLAAMGNKYFLLKLFIIVFMSVLCFLIIRSAAAMNLGDVKTFYIVIGGFFAVLGNYLQTVKPNYFIGIRTPWTLENETVWRKTHNLGGKLYFIAGLLIIILPFMLKENFRYFFLPIIIISSLIPIVYSFVIYKSSTKINGGQES